MTNEIMPFGDDVENHTAAQAEAALREHSSPDEVRDWLSQFSSGDVFQGLGAFDFSEEGIEDEGFPDISPADIEVVSMSDMDKAIEALKAPPKLGGTRTKKRDTHLRTITVDDFESREEKIAFTWLKTHIDALFDPKVKPESKVKAAHWIFGRYNHALNFSDCAKTLGSRKDVIRLRIHFEFWRRWNKFPVDFPFMIEPVPDLLEGAIYLAADEEGADIARVVWRHPGIRTEELITEASGGENIERYLAALEKMAARYIMSPNLDHWYLTGRNPILQSIDISSSPYKPAIRHISWSKMF